MKKLLMLPMLLAILLIFSGCSPLNPEIQKTTQENMNSEEDPGTVERTEEEPISEKSVEEQPESVESNEDEPQLEESNKENVTTQKEIQDRSLELENTKTEADYVKSVIVSEIANQEDFFFYEIKGVSNKLSANTWEYLKKWRAKTVELAAREILPGVAFQNLPKGVSPPQLFIA